MEHGGLSNWRGIANFAKTRPAALRLADFLGRGRGRLRVLDDWNNGLIGTGTCIDGNGGTNG